MFSLVWSQCSLLHAHRMAGLTFKHAAQGRCLRRANGVCATLASRRTRLDVRAFLGAQQISKAALCVPSPFIRQTSDNCPLELLNGTIYHGSQWAADLFPSRCQGQAAFETALARWSVAYTHLGETHLVLADESTQEAFLFFVADLVNNGSFGDASPTGKRSQVMGLYRVHLGAAGQATDVWLFRSGTEEEHQHLLRHSNTAAKQRSPTAHGQGAAAHSVTLAPCTWATDQFYAAAILSNAGTWTQDVMSQGCLSSLMRVAAPDITLTDGTGLLHAPLRGPVCVGYSLMDQMAQCDLQPRVMAAQVMEPGSNKICQHWSQMRTCRSTGQQSSVSGATLLVFDSKARIQQVFEFVGLDQPHMGFVDEQAVAHIRSCYPEGAGEAGRGAGQQAAEERAAAEAQRLQEEAECLARQEREWASW